MTFIFSLCAAGKGPFLNGTNSENTSVSMFLNLFGDVKFSTDRPHDLMENSQC